MFFFPFAMLPHDLLHLVLDICLENHPLFDIQNLVRVNSLIAKYVVTSKKIEFCLFSLFKKLPDWYIASIIPSIPEDILAAACKGVWFDSSVLTHWIALDPSMIKKHASTLKDMFYWYPANPKVMKKVLKYIIPLAPYNQCRIMADIIDVLETIPPNIQELLSGDFYDNLGTKAFLFYRFYLITSPLDGILEHLVSYDMIEKLYHCLVLPNTQTQSTQIQYLYLYLPPSSICKLGKNQKKSSNPSLIHACKFSFLIHL